MKALVYQLLLRTPVLISRPGAGEENSEHSYPFINGAAIRGALATRYLHQYADDESFRRRFLTGEVRFLHAYPVYEDKRTIPAPLSWHVAKNEKDKSSTEAFDFVYGVPDPDELKNPKSLGERFVIPTDDSVTSVSMPMQVSVHNVSRERGVKKKGTSSLFQYEAIAPGYRFAGAILGEEDDLKIIQALLVERPELWLGGSRNAGYGRTVVLKTDIGDDGEEPSGLQQDGLQDHVVITLLSDTIVRDANGSYSVHPHDLISIVPETAYMRTRVVGGFNRTWGLPVVQAPAFQAGSVFVYDAAAVDSSKLTNWQEKGLGERRVEGFGRIVVNWLPGRQFSLLKKELPIADNGESEIKLGAESQKLAQMMAQRRYQSLLDQHLLTQLSRLSLKKKSLTNAQLNKLRRVLRQVQSENSWKTLTEHLKELNNDAKKQMKSARIDGEIFIVWLQKAMNHGLWDEYFAQTSSPKIAGEEAQAHDALKLTYGVRLIDALLQKASKEKVQ